MLYMISANIVVRLSDGFEHTRTVPVFVLDSSIYSEQTPERVERAALSIIKTGIGDNFVSADVDVSPYTPRA